MAGDHLALCSRIPRVDRPSTIPIARAPSRGSVQRQDAGCEQFEVFQSVADPDKLVLLELWKDQAALDAHAKLQAQRPPLPEGLRLGAGEREDYTYNRTR